MSEHVRCVITPRARATTRMSTQWECCEHTAALPFSHHSQTAICAHRLYALSGASGFASATDKQRINVQVHRNIQNNTRFDVQMDCLLSTSTLWIQLRNSTADVAPSVNEHRLRAEKLYFLQGLSHTATQQNTLFCSCCITAAVATTALLSISLL